MYKKYISELRKICRGRGIKLQKIGDVGKKKEYPMFKIILGHGKKVVCFSGGIHGEEPAGPWAILEFIKHYNPKKYKDIKIVLFPVTNPYGFDKGVRHNFLNLDLNNCFCRRILLGENKILHNTIKDENIFFFHALHENKGFKKFYLYNFEKKTEKIYRDIIVSAKKYFPIETEKYIYGVLLSGGLITNHQDGSFEDRMFRDGVPYSMCTETPEAQLFSKRIELNVKIMNIVLDFTKKSK
ncbi:MAG: succinylglutamate desuccinylase/aspartoacylase family protein [Patescibacteria group bacterium]